MATPIRVEVVGDTRDLQVNVGRAEDSLRSLEDTARASAAGVENAMGGVADQADTVASKGSQAAGALSGLGSMAAESGGALGALGGAMVATGTVSQTLADAGDLLNVVTDSAIVKNIALKAQTIATATAQKAAAAAQWALNAAMSANPITLVVIAIAALVAGFVVAYKKSETFREIVHAAFSSVQEIGERVAGFFTNTIPKALDKITGAASGVVSGVKDKFNNLVEFFTRMPDRMKSAVSGIWNGVRDGFKDVINTVIGWWNDFSLSVDIPDAIPGLPDSFNINTPDIPYLAKGGRADRASLVVIGDGREPESVLPDSMMERALARAAAAGAAGGSTGGGTHIHIGTVQAHNYDDFRRQMSDQNRFASMDGIRRWR